MEDNHRITLDGAPSLLHCRTFSSVDYGTDPAPAGDLQIGLASGLRGAAPWIASIAQGDPPGYYPLFSVNRSALPIFDPMELFVGRTLNDFVYSDFQLTQGFLNGSVGRHFSYARWNSGVSSSNGFSILSSISCSTRLTSSFRLS